MEIEDPGDLGMTELEQLQLLDLTERLLLADQILDQRILAAQMRTGPGQQEPDLQVEQVLIAIALDILIVQVAALLKKLVIAAVGVDLGFDIDGKEMFDQKAPLGLG